MAQIQITNLSFAYEGSYDLIFDHVNLTLDTDWRTGLIGRNGRGKTTLLKLLLGQERPLSGSVLTALPCDYFPFSVQNPALPALCCAKAMIAPFDRWEAQMETLLAREDEAALEAYGELQLTYMAADGYIIEELLTKEAGKLGLGPDMLSRPFETLSPGQRTRLTLAALFLRKNRFLLIDEPTNHLDIPGRRLVGDYLASKSGFLLVSHDRDFLDRVTDHILSINRDGFELQQGNYTSWKENRDRQDQFELERNQALEKDIRRLTEAARQTARWSDKVEASKIGSHVGDRGHVGHMAAKMMKRSKATQQRQLRAAEEKKGLLKNLEESEDLKLHPLPYTRGRLLDLSDLSLGYGSDPVVRHLRFALAPGQRLCLWGGNGSGKSTVIKFLAGDPAVTASGVFRLGPGLVVSYVPQDTGFLRGSLDDFIHARDLDESLFKAILRKLDFSRLQFEKPLEGYSSGQKKKVLIAASLCVPAHLYLWDEPLNFIDILSRVQIEALITRYRPTMVFVEHDAAFCRAVATDTLVMDSRAGTSGT